MGAAAGAAGAGDGHDRAGRGGAGAAQRDGVAAGGGVRIDREARRDAPACPPADGHEPAADEHSAGTLWRGDAQEVGGLRGGRQGERAQHGYDDGQKANAAAHPGYAAAGPTWTGGSCCRGVWAAFGAAEGHPRHAGSFGSRASTAESPGRVLNALPAGSRRAPADVHRCRMRSAGTAHSPPAPPRRSAAGCAACRSGVRIRARPVRFISWRSSSERRAVSHAAEVAVVLSPSPTAVVQHGPPNS